MTSSLVGSEMCIRDRSMGVPTPRRRVSLHGEPLPLIWLLPPGLLLRPVSYTHLTLPTICSV
eukprot:8868884-Prorocentrum_lima.AAC.1